VRRHRDLLERAPLCIAIAALVAHSGYYTLVIGGDHFEYRVYSHLVPLLFVSAVWLASRIARRSSAACALVGAFVLASWPIQWVHWDETRSFDPRREVHAIRHRISHRFPVWLRPLVRPFDEWQNWLISHYVCVRHQEHKLFLRHQLETHPTRERGSSLRWEDRPVTFLKAVGVPGWVLPEVAVIDVFGLNDRVVARNPAPRQPRMMAHERKPPAGYVECFRPNVRIERGALVVEPRDRALDDDEIRRCEAREWLGADAGAPPPTGEFGPTPDFR
jgi:arabinofuranosyltransferase